MAARTIAVLAVSRLEYLITNPWLIGAVALLSMSFGAIAVTGAKELSAQEERYALELQQRVQASMQPVGPSGRQVERALRVIRPPSAAGFLIAGEEPTMPAGWDLGPGAVEVLPPYPAWSEAMRFGNAADGAAFIVQSGGLLALSLGLIGVLRDRRRGWTDAERSTASPASMFLAAELVSACFALALVVSIWFGTIWLVTPQVLANPWEEATRTISMLSFPTWCYLVALYGYGAAIGWFVRAPFRAVASAAIFWACLALVWPQLASYWSNWGAVVPSRTQAEQHQRDGYSDRVRSLENELGRKVATFVDGDIVEPEQAAQAEKAFEKLEAVWNRGLADARAEANASEETWRTQSDRLASRLQHAARFTPVTLLPQVLAEVSGTGRAMRNQWQEKVDEYKRRLDSAVFDDRPTVTLRLPLSGSIKPFGYVRHRPIPFRELPQFVAPTISASDCWQAAKGDALVLALHAMAALVLASVAHRRAWRRYDFVSSSAEDVGRP